MLEGQLGIGSEDADGEAAQEPDGAGIPGDGSGPLYGAPGASEGPSDEPAPPASAAAADPEAETGAQERVPILQAAVP